MSEHRLDRWLRARHVWLRVGLGVTALLELLAWYSGWTVLGVILFLPGAVFFYLVAMYLPRSRL